MHYRWMTCGFTDLWKRLEIHTACYMLLLVVRQNKRFDFCCPNNSCRYNASHFREHHVARLIAMVSNCQTWERSIGTPDTYLMSNNVHYTVWLESHSKTEFTWLLAACVTTNKATTDTSMYKTYLLLFCILHWCCRGSKKSHNEMKSKMQAHERDNWTVIKI